MNLTLILLMAGRGTRTQDSIPTMPKPFIKIHDIPLFLWALAALLPLNPKKIVLLMQEKDLPFLPPDLEKKLGANLQIISLTEITEGALCTLLKADTHLEGEILVANADQFVNSELITFHQEARESQASGSLLTFTPTDPSTLAKWSYIRPAELFSTQEVVEVIEKKPISSFATVGYYWFRNGRELKTHAEAMIARNERTLGEFYLAPIYNYFIRARQKVIHHTLLSDCNRFFPLGTTLDIQAFQRHPDSLLFAQKIKSFLYE